MAKKHRIDMVSELTENQHNNGFIVLTTYCFDPFFFDICLLRALQENNPGAEIVVLVDGAQYELSYDRFTHNTGRSYHLVPVYLPKGVFHPKLFLFLSPDGKEGTVYVGSGNITLHGFTSNAELVTKIVLAPSKDGNLRITLIELLTGLLRKYVEEPKVATIFSDLMKGLEPTQPTESADVRTSSVLHNLNRPILQQMLERVGNVKARNALLMAPFLSRNPQVVINLSDGIKVGKVTLALQRGHHNLSDVSGYKKALTSKGVKFEVMESKFSEPSRQFHSKIIYLDGPEKCLLVGSPNLTSGALLETVESGNLECAVLHKGKDFAEILEDVKLTAPDDIKSLLKASEPTESPISSSIKILAADFDDIARTLIIKIEPLTGAANVDVTVEEPLGMIEDEFPHGKSEITLSVPQGIPKEVSVTCKGKTGRRRIFYDRHYFIKRIARSEASFDEISAKLYHDFSMDISELLAIISALARQTLEPDTTTGGRIETRPERKHYLPSRPKGISSPGSLLHDLEALLRWTNSRKGIQRDIEASSTGENSEELSAQSKYPSYLDQDEERTKLVIKILSSLNKIVMLSASTAKTSPSNAILSAQSILLDFFLRIFRQSVDVVVLQRLSQFIDENLQTIQVSDCGKSDLARFFARLAAMSYCYRYAFPHLYLRDVISCSEMAADRNYFEARRFAKELIERYYPEMGFDEENFMDAYCELLPHFLSPNDVFDEVCKIVENLISQTGPTGTELLGKTLLAIKNSHRFVLERLTKTVAERITGCSGMDSKKADYFAKFVSQDS